MNKLVIFFRRYLTPTEYLICFSTKSIIFVTEFFEFYAIEQPIWYIKHVEQFLINWIMFVSISRDLITNSEILTVDSIMHLNREFEKNELVFPFCEKIFVHEHRHHDHRTNPRFAKLICQRHHRRPRRLFYRYRNSLRAWLKYSFDVDDGGWVVLHLNRWRSLNNSPFVSSDLSFGMAFLLLPICWKHAFRLSDRIATLIINRFISRTVIVFDKTSDSTAIQFKNV